MSSYFEASMLPDPNKRAVCQELLSEFGATVKSVNDKSGEMIHGCLVAPELHKDQTHNPTASLNYKKLTYNCLGCGSSGGLLWFIATCRGETSVAARAWLEKTAGLGGTVLELDAMLRFLDNIYAKPQAVPIPTFSTKLLDGWAYNHPYFTEARGISEKAYGKFRLGWDPTTDRVVLPHFWEGKLVGWQTRKLPMEWVSQPPVPNMPKYLSSPDFPKESTIFNYRPREREAVVMEAMLSAITHSEHFHSEAVFGAKVTDLQVRRLVKHDRVILWMDNDKAGWRAIEGRPEEKPTKEKPQGAERILGIAEKLAPYTEVLVVDSPWSQDPNELSHEEALALKDSAVPWGLWRRPEQLYCFHCRDRAHEGPCRAPAQS